MSEEFADVFYCPCTVLGRHCEACTQERVFHGVCVCVSVWFCVSVPVRVRASVRPRARVCAGSAQSCVRKGRISRRKEKKDREREIMLTQSIGGKEKPCKQFFF